MTTPKHPNSNLREWTRKLRSPNEGEPGSNPVSGVDAEARDNGVGWVAEHARRYVATDGAADGWEGPRPILVLYTKGRRSGAIRRNPLLCFEHGGERYVIASLGGAPTHPHWYLNLVADPLVQVRVGAELYEARARTLSAGERERLWPELVARYPMFGDYERLTDRVIPMVHLGPLSRSG